MNNAADSYDDATSATCFDPTYVKGFWRLGQACMALGKTQEAIDSYKSALGLDGNNKALKKELIKAEKQLVKDAEEAARKEKEKEEMANRPPPPPPSTKSKPASSTSSSTNNNSNKSTTDTAAEDGEFTKSDHVRGYKIVNGKKTSFFHHEQTEEEKRLIGDITPKLLDPNTISQSNDGGSSSSNNNNNPNQTQDKDVSAWNKAGTWEEKDVTEWALESIKRVVMGASYILPEGSPDPNAIVKVVDVSKLISSKKAGGTAHASVAKVRGKKKYIFEFTVCVHWEMTLGGGSGNVCRGKMTFYDVDGTHVIGEGYDVTDYEVENGAPADARHLLERFVKNSGLRTEVEAKLDEWIGLFRETY